jgi:nucleoside-diphosphate-sugar epimerase
MRVVVTGATGNLGTAVVPRLLAAGHEVHGIARRPPPADPATPALRWTALDLTALDRAERLRAVMEGVDAVIHLAWGFQPTRDAAYLRRLDVGGTEAVLDAARAAGVARLVHISSVGAYSPATSAVPVDESWPTGGIPKLPYSRHKVEAERLLDAHEAVPGHRPAVTRIRPSLMASEAAGSALDRYALPSLLPARLVGLLPVLPMDRRFRVQLTHSADIAEGVVLALEKGLDGAVNLAAGPVLERDDIARALGAKPVQLPWSGLRAAAALAWMLRLQPVDPGWLDLAWEVPLMSSARAEDELGWVPRHDARAVLAEAVKGMVHQGAGDTPALRPRRLSEQARRLLTEGPVSRRRQA